MVVKFSIIVPAYKEQGNLEPLTKRITAAMESAGHPRSEFEIIIVDDNSRDGSEETVFALQRDNYPVQIIVRTKERGLSSAVLHGFAAAKADCVLCMDADLQHPPEYVPKMCDSLAQPGIEFTLGTRYGAGVAIDKDWPVHRRIISWGARLLARPLTPLSDPMSGFFGMKKGVLNRGLPNVSAIGYKIALELFVKSRVRNFNEVGFSFAARTVGESKLTGKVIVHYLKHLRTLYAFKFGYAFFVVLFLLMAVALVLLLVLAVRF
jgi:dolichol-phosphate mannosyltransferase